MRIELPPINRTHASLLPLTLVLAACAGAETPASDPQREASPHESGGGEQAHGGVQEAQVDLEPSERERLLALHMGNYFWMAIDAREALIAGRLADAKTRMRQLSEQPAPADLMPPEWLPDMQRVIDEANQLAAATNLQEASESMARMAVACGDCHAKRHAGPLPNTRPISRPGPDGEDLGDRMARHRWAADALWCGLSRRSESDWRAGAEALIEAPPGSPVAAADLTPSQQAEMELVRKLGQRALAAEATEARARTYADLLQTCSRCHEH